MILGNSFLVLLGYNSGNARSQSISKQAHQLGAVLGNGGIPIVFISIHGVVTHSLMFRSFVYRYTRTEPINWANLTEAYAEFSQLTDLLLPIYYNFLKAVYFRVNG